MEWIFARWLTFVATVLVTGVCAVGLGVLPRTVIDDGARRAIAHDASRLGIIAALAMIPASILRLLDQLFALRSSGDPLLAGFAPLMMSTTWGTGFRWQSAAILVTLLGMLLIRREPQVLWRWMLAGAGALGLSVTLSLQGHAIGNEFYTAVSVSADIAHVLGAGLWLGGIAAIGWVGCTIPNSDGHVHPELAASADARLRLLVPLVPAIALTGAALLVSSGTVSSVLSLRTVSDLWGTEWGRYVMLKVVLVLGIMTLGALNWRRLGPAMRATAGVPALRRSLLIELALAAIVLLVTAVLVVTPLPGE